MGFDSSICWYAISSWISSGIVFLYIYVCLKCVCKCNWGKNALHWATQFSKKSAEIVIALLNHSTTNINVINQQEKTYGFTPLDKAYRRLSKLQQTRNRTKQDNEEQVIYHIINAILLKGGVSIIHQ